MKSIERALYRIIDANLNRSREGLRVCEDIARFALNASGTTAELKSVRHAISATITSLGPGVAPLLAARDSVRDVGREPMLASERRRVSYADIFAANIERVKESLRVLEEVSKLIDTRAAKRFMTLRFKVYDIEKRALIEALER